MEQLIRHQAVLAPLFARREDAAKRVASLTPPQPLISELVLAGHPSKSSAVDFGITQRTVERHRISIMKKTGSKSHPALARMALGAAWSGADEKTVHPLANRRLPLLGTAPERPIVQRGPSLGSAANSH